MAAIDSPSGAPSNTATFADATFGPMLEIRRVGEGDTDALWAVLGDPQVARWLRPAGTGGPYTRSECADLVERKVAHWAAHGFGMMLGFVGERCVGRATVGYNLVDGRAELEIGWAVVSDLWGAGLGTVLGRHALESARAAGFRRVVAFTRTDNLGSQRVMAKLGMSYERDFEHSGYPHVLYVWGAGGQSD
jgi:RimJ/RimL family protein N-acetyltransferase